MADLNFHPARSAVRSEARERVVHLVEYSRYPRQAPGEARRVAYTQDRSNSGLGIDISEAIEPGELLRVTLRDIDGNIDMDGLARVVWCHPTASGRARAGLSILREGGDKPMLRVQRSGKSESSTSHASR